jgi:hypothetical protein
VGILPDGTLDDVDGDPTDEGVQDSILDENAEILAMEHREFDDED